jgi:hypothetical protein
MRDEKEVPSLNPRFFENRRKMQEDRSKKHKVSSQKKASKGHLVQMENRKRTNRKRVAGK